ncbi:MAG: zinc transporter ZupT [Victivallaceae bacterium]
MEIGFDRILWGLGLSLFAGLATGIGSCLAFFSNRSDTRFLAVSLGFSGGVMIYISLTELLGQANHKLVEIYGKQTGSLYAIAAFFGGIGLAMLIDRLVPADENPHEVRKVEEMTEPRHRHKLVRSGILFALAIGIHNFPEGMATFSAALAEPVTGISIAIAVAIHNIPEGITVSVPIYFATGSRRKAFYWSMLSGLAEPVGAVIAWLVLMPFLTPSLLALTFAAVAGIMVYISFDELLPLAEEYGRHHLVIYGLIAGMLVMALTLVFA